MASSIQPGQALTITNLNYGVQQEDWIVLAVAYPAITFACTKYQAVDIASIEYTSTQTVAGKVVEDDGSGVIVAFSQYVGTEVGLRIVGNQATYLQSLAPLKHA